MAIIKFFAVTDLVTLLGEEISTSFLLINLATPLNKLTLFFTAIVFLANTHALPVEKDRSLLEKLFNKDLINAFHNASCFVCPSLFEPWGLVVNEALSSGLPVIATKEVGACYDLLENKETGLIAENNIDIGEKMLQLFEDADLLKKYSLNATALMKGYWNYNLYESCLNDAINKVKEWL